MLDLLSRLNGGEVIGLVAVVGGLFVAITGIISGCWKSYHCAEIDASLKQDMLERGMSADEIEKVLKTKSA